MSCHAQDAAAVEDMTEIGRLHTHAADWEACMLAFMRSGGYHVRGRLAQLACPAWSCGAGRTGCCRGRRTHGSWWRRCRARGWCGWEIMGTWRMWSTRRGCLPCAGVCRCEGPGCACTACWGRFCARKWLQGRGGGARGCQRLGSPAVSSGRNFGSIDSQEESGNAGQRGRADLKLLSAKGWGRIQGQTNLPGVVRPPLPPERTGEAGAPFRA